ncbi:MAG: T9SS type A sorting domain-containing protein, partial [Bacteroidota bacterium]
FVIRSNARNIVPLEVAVEVSGTATRFVDYTTNATRSIVRIPAGRTSARFSVLPLADAEAEGDETVTLTLVDDDADYEVIGTGSATVTIADGPAPTDLSLVRALPGRGGAGPVTLRIAGQAMMDGTTATLTCAGTPYDAQLATAGPEGTLLTAQFNLTGQKPELCDLAVTSGGATATLPQAFRVVSVRRPADLTLDLISPERRRRGRSVRHRVIVTNRGNVDAYMVPVEISVNGGASIQPEFAVENPVEEPDLPNMPDEFPGWDAIPTQVDIDGRRELSIVVPVIPAGGEVELTFRSDASSLSASVLTPLLVDYIPGTTTGTLAPEYQEALEQMAQNGTGSVALCWTRKLGFAAVATLGQAFGNLSQCVRSASLAVVAAANQAVSAYAGTATTLSYQRTATIMAGGLVSCLNAAGRSIPWSRGLALAVNLASAAYDAYHECPEEPEETETEEVASFDPNDKLGPVGATEARYIRGDEGRVYYTVRFENLVSATAPAAEVFITDSLDVSVFDPTSFRVHSVSFADQTVTAPPGLSAWNAEVDLRPSDPILLQISGSIDDEGLISWTFVSLDPETLDLPEDPLIGFLPPNVTPPEGEGSVTFSVALREGLPDGTEVANEARIVFDVNEPIDTPVWSNTIDRTAPTSSVTSVGYSAASDTTLVLYLSGSDAGSGVLSYDIYASRDGGPFEFAFTADTDTPTFEAERGSLYGFFSIARDYVDNLEDPKTEAEAVTTWPVDSESTDPSLPDAVSLVAPYPNPSRGSAVLQFGLPAPTRVDLRVYDVQGREIARLAEGEHTAGWHRLPWTFSDLAPGVYLVRFQADDETFTERLTVVR